MDGRSQRRDAVERCALDLFVARGYDAVTVEDICAATGVSPATFYRYFGAKDELLFGYAAQLHDGLRDAVAALDPADGLAQLLGDLLRSLAVAVEKFADDMALREAIFAAHPGLMGRALAVLTGWQQELAAALRPVAGDDADFAAALGVAVLQVAWQRSRAGAAGGLLSAVEDGLHAARSFGGLT